MRTLTRKRDLLIAACFVVALAALAIGERMLEQAASAQAKGAVMAPRFEVDPMFPKPLPNNWYMGMTIGVAVDAQDHIWIVHRPDSVTGRGELAADDQTGECCSKAPPILEFDQQGNLLRHWGGKDGPGYTWPLSNHGIWIDYKGNVWIGGNGTSGDTRDGQILKFTQDGKFLAQYGQANVRVDSNSMEHFGGVAKIFVDPKANEAYIADGYGNRRVAVIDADNGKVKRYWGAYGEKPDDTPTPRYDPKAPLIRQFRTPVHCADLSNDGFVYVCDRPNDRIQVFSPDGKFVKEVRIAPDTMGDGSVWDVAFSKDPAQKYLYLADGKNEKVYVIDRQSMEILTSFGDGGRQPGQFYAVHSIAVDSKGNIYTTETYEGRRLQKFAYKGLAPVTAKDQGTVWPKTTQR